MFKVNIIEGLFHILLCLRLMPLFPDLSVRLACLILPTYFIVRLIFVTIHGSYCTF